MNTTLERTTFSTSRLLEFFTEKELTMQMGHSKDWWPIATIKELIDNALDACEIAGIQPHIEIAIGDDNFSVSDNGPGLPEKTLMRSLDYMVRVSDKTYYISPTRGQLGNALKCVYAAPFVASGESGRVEIRVKDISYRVEISLDRIAQKPVMNVTTEDVPCKNGTKVTVWWPDLASYLERPKNMNPYKELPPTICELVTNYGMFNPHATFRTQDSLIEATDPDWKKWKPNSPTSIYWYDAERLRSLIAAYITANEGEKTIREFVSEFRGLAGTAKQKQVTEDAGLHGKCLSDLVSDGDVAIPLVEKLLSAMKEHSNPVKANILGVIGKEHFTIQMVENHGVEPDSVRYKKIAHSDDLSHTLEMAFGVYREENEDKLRTIITGLNWAPTLGIPVREFHIMLGKMRIDRRDPVCVVMHIARPTFEFIDRGKGQLDV